MESRRCEKHGCQLGILKDSENAEDYCPECMRESNENLDRWLAKRKVR